MIKVVLILLHFLFQLRTPVQFFLFLCLLFVLVLVLFVVNNLLLMDKDADAPDG
jgi:hypothetical protein